MRGAAVQISERLKGARLAPGANRGELASVLYRRMRAGDRDACTTVIRRAVPADGPARRSTAVALVAVAAVAVGVAAHSSLELAVLAALALCTPGLGLWLFGGEVFVVMFRLATSPALRRAAALRDDIRRLAAGGDVAALSRYDELSAVGTTDPIAGWIRAEAIEALATMDYEAAQKRAFTAVRELIEGDSIAPGAAGPLARTLVSVTPRFEGTEALLEKLSIVAPEVGVHCDLARDEIARRRAGG